MVLPLNRQLIQSGPGTSPDEAMGGLRYLTGQPGEPSVRVGVSIGDSLSALYAVIGRPDLAEDPELAHNDGRTRHAQRIDAAIEAWSRQYGRDDILAALDEARVPAGYPYTAADTRAKLRDAGII